MMWFAKLRIGDEFYFRDCCYRKRSPTSAWDLTCGGHRTFKPRCAVIPCNTERVGDEAESLERR